MKKLTFLPVILLLAAGLPLSSKAQVLKNLLNNMKSNQGNKKSDSPGVKTSFDTAYMNQLMAKQRRAKPSISPADSAAAIKAFMSGTGGGGWFYQYRVSYSFTAKNKTNSSTDTMAVMLADSHNSRSDMGMLGEKTYLLGHANMPHYSMFIYPDTKTYKFNIIDTAAINSSNGMTYQVTKIGNETIGGYNCIHSRMVTTTSNKMEIAQDIWTCKDVPGYQVTKRYMTMQNFTPPMLKALEQAGCDGMFVKMTMKSSTYSMDMILTAAERKTFPDSMFQLPSGYTPQPDTNPFAHGLPQH